MFISTHLCSKSEVINFLCAQKDSDLNSFDIFGKLFNLSHPLDMVAQVKLKKSSVMDSPSTISVNRRLAQFSHSDAPRLILSVHRQA